jgi:hypothetical protein
MSNDIVTYMPMITKERGKKKSLFISLYEAINGAQGDYPSNNKKEKEIYGMLN